MKNKGLCHGLSLAKGNSLENTLKPSPSLKVVRSSQIHLAPKQE